MTEQQKTRHELGEEKINQAFRNSLLVIGAVAVVAAGVWFANQKTEPEQVVEAEIAAPVIEEAPPPEQAGPPAIPFTDITEQAGIDFVHVTGAYGDKLIPETMGSGLAFFDYDNDGDPDLYLVNSTYWPDKADGKATTSRLYRNDGDGKFSDVTAEVGLERDTYGFGVATGDYDGDGWTDLFVSNLGLNYLYRNNQGQFEDVTKPAGVSGNPEDWSTGAFFFDYDQDGDLDLFSANYVTWTRDIDLEIDFRLTGLGRAYGAPNHHTGAQNRLYRNDGDGKFSDVSQSAGIQVSDAISGRPVGKALGATAIDLDQDGDLDILVANDTVRNFLYRNQGDGTFVEEAVLEGMAYDRIGKATSGMGIDVAQFRNDQDLGIVLGNFANEMSSLYVTLDGQGPFVDEAVLEGFGPDSRLALTFSVFFLDADLDGKLDLFQANGHLENEINRVHPSQQYAQPAQLFWQCGEDCPNRFELLEDVGDLAQPMVGRGAAYADIDNDGDLDLAILQNGRSAKLLRNDQQLGNHWLRLKLVGDAGNREAIGASVELTADGATQRRVVMPSRGYISQSELYLTFGLGANDKVDSLKITWPDGVEQAVEVDGVDRVLEISKSDQS